MKRLFSISFVLFFSVAFVAPQSDLQPLATVKLHKTESITLRQLKERVELEKISFEVDSFSIEEKKAILDAMIDQMLVMQAAAQMGMVLTEAQVDQYFLQALSGMVGFVVTEQEFADIVKAQYNMSLDEYFMQSARMTVKEYKAYMETQMISEAYVMQLKQNQIEQNAIVTDQEIRDYYEINRTQLVQNDIIQLFMVIVPKGDNPATAKALVDSLHSDLKNSKTTYSELTAKALGADSGFRADDIYMPKGGVPVEQLAMLGMDEKSFLALFTQNIGFFGDITETATDYNFYVVLDKQGAKMLSLSDIIEPGTTVTVYDYIRNGLSQQKMQYAFGVAVQEVTQSLRTPENYQMLKTGSALDALLDF